MHAYNYYELIITNFASYRNKKFASNHNKNSIQSENKSLQIADIASNHVKNLLHIYHNKNLLQIENILQIEDLLQIVRKIAPYRSINLLRKKKLHIAINFAFDR